MIDYAELYGKFMVQMGEVKLIYGTRDEAKKLLRIEDVLDEIEDLKLPPEKTKHLREQWQSYADQWNDAYVRNGYYEADRRRAYEKPDPTSAL